MNLYRSCQHQCNYCNSQSECYHLEDFSDIHIKSELWNFWKKVIKKTSEVCKMLSFGVTLRDRQREYFYNKLDKLFSEFVKNMKVNLAIANLHP